MATHRMTLKLLINTRSNQVLFAFAEAGKDFVDFLCHLMALPIATVVRLVREQGIVGCLGDLYESIENLNETYIQPDSSKDSLLNPAASSVALSLLEGPKEGYVCTECYDVTHYSDDQRAICPGCLCNMTYSITYVAAPPGVVGNSSGKFRKSGVGYICPKCDVSYFSDDKRASCPDCKRKMTHAITYVAPPPCAVTIPSGEGGFVKGEVTYMVQDDLVVTPMSMISSITLLNKFKVKDLSTLREQEVHIGMSEGLNLLKTSLQSKNVLSEVFLTNK